MCGGDEGWVVGKLKHHEVQEDDEINQYTNTNYLIQ